MMKNFPAIIYNKGLSGAVGDCWYSCTDSPHPSLNYVEYVRHDLFEELEGKIRSLSDSRSHYRISAKTQKDRCHRLRHKKKALLITLQKVLDAKTLNDAKFAARIGINGWSDSDIVSNYCKPKKWE